MRSFMTSSVLVALAAFSSVASALPAPPKFFGCDVSKLGPTFPTNQTALAKPAGSTAKFVGLGAGVQNYTCTDAGTYASAGAVAQLYDVSCIASTPLFKMLPDMAFSLQSRASAISSISKTLGSNPLKLGDHYFVTAPSGTGISPKFDFTASQKSADAFVLAAKAANIASPAGSANVDWLQLNNVQGALAKTVFRVDTKAGQPPASCTPGSALISVPYAAMYWFFV
ncbi:hypothetical protein EXIGLDRAFT_643551 [Exidia glandulosa HHB12029]|uniref:Malate dehydrogenase n=1 Tax=Exidia glandulosa HHB12029 TaxID=1314781 RepID=A0A165KBU1_EXIGL|nr:hypothetical protein EXIGLDRAFT_643551 [Exidia glandulosa HHB12029]